MWTLNLCAIIIAFRNYFTQHMLTISWGNTETPPQQENLRSKVKHAAKSKDAAAGPRDNNLV